MSYADFLSVEGVRRVFPDIRDSQPHSVFTQVWNAGETQTQGTVVKFHPLRGHMYGTKMARRNRREGTGRLPRREALSVSEDPLLSDQRTPTPVCVPGKIKTKTAR